MLTLVYSAAYKHRDEHMVRLTMAVLLLSVHPLFDQSLLHSHEYPVLLIIRLN